MHNGQYVHYQQTHVVRCHRCVLWGCVANQGQENGIGRAWAPRPLGLRLQNLLCDVWFLHTVVLQIKSALVSLRNDRVNRLTSSIIYDIRYTPFCIFILPKKKEKDIVVCPHPTLGPQTLLRLSIHPIQLLHPVYNTILDKLSHAVLMLTVVLLAGHCSGQGTGLAV